MSESKDELRNRLKADRLATPDLFRNDWSKTIVDRLKRSIPWDKIEYAHVYMPILSLGEIDLRPLYEWIEQEHPQVQLFTSKKIDNEWQVTSVGANPAGDEPAFEVVVVPMLGFDETLNRIGYGGGYYDRLLAKHPSAQKIGVCFELGRVDIIPTEPHDISLDSIITEEHIYRRS